MTLTLGSTFPNFDAQAFGVDKFNLYDYLGNSWGLFMSHPNDFTPVCTTELTQAVKLCKTFQGKNCKIVGFSCNDLNAHKEWAKDIMAQAGQSGDLPFPLVCDPERSIAQTLGIMDPIEKTTQGLPLTCRAVYFIGPDRKVKAMILYPATTGRSMKEILRVLESLQLTEEFPVATPVEWQPGQDVCVIPNMPVEAVKKQFPNAKIVDVPSGQKYLTYTPDPKN